MADGRELFESALIAIMGTSLSVFMIRFGGEVLDRIISKLTDVGMYEISSSWQTGSQESLINLFYIVCMMPCVLSIVVAYLRTQKTTESDIAQFQSGGGYL